MRPRLPLSGERPTSVVTSDGNGSRSWPFARVWSLQPVETDTVARRAATTRVCGCARSPRYRNRLAPRALRSRRGMADGPHPSAGTWAGPGRALLGRAHARTLGDASSTEFVPPTRSAPDEAFSHDTAARLLGLPLPDRGRPRSRGTSPVRPSCRGSRRVGVVSHRGLERRRVVTCDGVPCTDPLTTWADLAGGPGAATTSSSWAMRWCAEAAVFRSRTCARWSRHAVVGAAWCACATP